MPQKYKVLEKVDQPLASSQTEAGSGSIPAPGSPLTASQILNRKRKYNCNAILKAKVKKGVLRIEIGVETLAWATNPENGGPLEGFRVRNGKELLWAHDVAREMMHEDGDYNGQPRVGEWLDEMILKAAENGSGALEENS